MRRDYFSTSPTMVVSTAHPAKFDTIVEPLIGTTVPIPKNLWEIIQKPSYAKEIGRNYKELF